jgi:hypothetical protein
MRRFLAAGVLGLTVTSQAIACETTLPYHLRIQDCRLASEVADASQRSSTLNNLIERIESSNALVFVLPPPHVGPASQLLGGVYYDAPFSGSYRIVRIFVSRNSGDAAVATFGHELRHVLELLDAVGAKDNVESKALDGRTAWQSGPHTIETQAALDAGNAIKRELKAAKRQHGSSNEQLAP